MTGVAGGGEPLGREIDERHVSWLDKVRRENLTRQAAREGDPEAAVAVAVAVVGYRAKLDGRRPWVDLPVLVERAREAAQRRDAA